MRIVGNPETIQKRGCGKLEAVQAEGETRCGCR
jgi:hypothetical protein